jgi:hypothetical protein
MAMNPSADIDPLFTDFLDTTDFAERGIQVSARALAQYCDNAKLDPCGYALVARPDTEPPAIRKSLKRRGVSVPTELE